MAKRRKLIFIEYFFVGECPFVECVPGAWSEWSADCGEMGRTRAIDVVEKTVKKASCEGLLQTCPKSEETEYNETLCKIIFCSILFKKPAIRKCDDVNSLLS